LILISKKNYLNKIFKKEKHMLKHLIGVEISPLRSALIFSYIGGILLVVIGLTFALPSTWVIFKDDFPGGEDFLGYLLQWVS
jgi:hypothetical protein